MKGGVCQKLIKEVVVDLNISSPLCAKLYKLAFSPFLSF